MNCSFDIEATRKRIKKIKKIRNWSTKELAEHSGVPLGTLNKILGGGTKDPQLSSIMKISYALDVSTDYLLGLTNISTPIGRYTDTEHWGIVSTLSESIADRLESGDYFKASLDIVEIMYNISEMLDHFNSIQNNINQVESNYLLAIQHHLAAQEYMQKLLADIKTEVLSAQTSTENKKALEALVRIESSGFTNQKQG